MPVSLLDLALHSASTSLSSLPGDKGQRCCGEEYRNWYGGYRGDHTLDTTAIYLLDAFRISDRGVWD